METEEDSGKSCTTASKGPGKKKRVRAIGV